MQRFLALVLLVTAGCIGPAADDDTAAPAAESPYAGEEARVLKALSPEEVEGYRTGGGLGYAKPAELNSYPGPLHALEMADRLQLTPEQRAGLTQIREEMLAAAIPLGERYLQVEAAIEQRFRDDTMDAQTLRELLDESAAVEAQLRYEHLVAHVSTKALLTPHQVALYEDARGYGEADHDSPAHDA